MERIWILIIEDAGVDMIDKSSAVIIKPTFIFVGKYGISHCCGCIIRRIIMVHLTQNIILEWKDLSKLRGEQ